MRPFLLALGLLAPPALAQDGWRPDWDVTADLDGNEAPETYELRDNGQGSVDLAVQGPGEERVVPGIAWLGGTDGQKPELSVNHAGSLLVASGNELVGRNRWRLVLTVAHRDGDLRVAGLTYSWHDTWDHETGWGRCDIDLVRAQGEVQTEAGTRAIELFDGPPRLWDWSDMEPAVPFMDLCREGL